MSGSVPAYSALYVERDALEHENTHRLRESLQSRSPDLPVVVVDSYREVFARPAQRFQEQKRRPAIIAALARAPRLYEVPPRACGLHDLPLCYTDQLRNCVYNCDYCFLQGMHPSGHTLVFVNDDRFHEAARDRARAGPFWLSISYLTDIAAFEEVLPLTRRWIDVSRSLPAMTLEVRTKGEAAAVIAGEPAENVVLVWTLSPPAVARRYEPGAPSAHRRIRAARAAAERGWRIRLAMDPVILHDGWRESYTNLISELSAELPARLVEAAWYGVFRMGRDYLGRITQARADSPILHHPFERSGSLATYQREEIEAVHETVGVALRRYLGENRVGFVHE